MPRGSPQFVCLTSKVFFLFAFFHGCSLIPRRSPSFAFFTYFYSSSIITILNGDESGLMSTLFRVGNTSLSQNRPSSSVCSWREVGVEVKGGKRGWLVAARGEGEAGVRDAELTCPATGKRGSLAADVEGDWLPVQVGDCGSGTRVVERLNAMSRL